MSRTRYTDEDKARLLGEFDACGGSAAAFCRERGLPYQTFITWRRGGMAARPMAAPAMEFVGLGVAQVGRGQAGTPRVELDLGGGMVLRIHLPTPRP